MPELDVSKLIKFTKQIESGGFDWDSFLENNTSTAPQVDYTSLDWIAFMSDMVEKIPQLTSEWTDYTASDMGMVILELVAFMMDALSYRNDVIANEAFLQTAVLRKSVTNLARMIDYAPKPAVSAMVELQFTIDGNLTANTVVDGDSTASYTIPSGTKVSTKKSGSEDKYIFETLEDLVFDSQETVKTVAAVQGETVSENLAYSTGFANQYYQLNYKPLAHNSDGTCSLDVYVGNGVSSELWTMVSNLRDCGPTDKCYEIETDENDVTTIVFGDNRNGAIPVRQVSSLKLGEAPVNKIIRAKYRIGGGKKGNVGAGTVIMMNSNIPGVKSVTNPSAATSGADRESVESIKRMAPRMLRTLWRAVTAEDYKTLAESIPGVAKATLVIPAVSERQYWGQVDLYIAPEGGGELTEAFKKTILDFFIERELLNVTTVIKDPLYVEVTVDVTVYVKENFIQLEVKNAVENALANFFEFSNVDFGQSIYLSDIIALADGIEGVKYVNASLSHLIGSGIDTVDPTRLDEAGNFIMAANEIVTLGSHSSVEANGGIVN